MAKFLDVCKELREIQNALTKQEIRRKNAIKITDETVKNIIIETVNTLVDKQEAEQKEFTGTPEEWNERRKHINVTDETTGFIRVFPTSRIDLFRIVVKVPQGAEEATLETFPDCKIEINEKFGPQIQFGYDADQDVFYKYQERK